MAREKKQKRRETKPSGKSHYALKIARRKKEAAILSLPPNTPYPIIWAYKGDGNIVLNWLLRDGLHES